MAKFQPKFRLNFLNFRTNLILTDGYERKSIVERIDRKIKHKQTHNLWYFSTFSNLYYRITLLGYSKSLIWLENGCQMLLIRTLFDLAMVIYYLSGRAKVQILSHFIDVSEQWAPLEMKKLKFLAMMFKLIHRTYSFQIWLFEKVSYVVSYFVQSRQGSFIISCLLMIFPWIYDFKASVINSCKHLLKSLYF